MTVYSILYATIFSLTVILGSENAFSSMTPSLIECYNTTYILTRDNRLPHNTISLIEIIRKIESTEGLDMDLKMLSVALLHRFRQDGIVFDPLAIPGNGIFPYAPDGYKVKRFKQILSTIPGNAHRFPNESISNIERCSLHFMLSSTIEQYRRDGEDSICNRGLDNAYRLPRSINDDSLINKSGSPNDDVEMLSLQQIESLTNNKQREEESEVDPNSFYPELPPNHPALANLESVPLSNCPVESGVIKTRWGSVAVGTVLAAIAAAMEPQSIEISDLLRGKNINPASFKYSQRLNNKWFATLAGDLAEVALLQLPYKQPNERFVIGVDGKWNSTNLPKWYFLSEKDKLELTRAELRAGIDGLIIAHDLRSWYEMTNGYLRLSQILDMYYSPRGVFGLSSRACNRRDLFTKVAPTETLEEQTIRACIVLQDIGKGSYDNITILEKSCKEAADQVMPFMASEMNDDLSCADTDRYNDFSRPFVDLTIVLDTTWPFKNIQPILAKILESIEVGKFNSNFTLISARNGEVMINTTNTILDLYNFTASKYEKFLTGFNMPKTIEDVRNRLARKLDEEQKQKIGGSNANVLLYIPHSGSISEADKDFCLEQIKQMKEEIPDTTILFLTYGSKDRWASLVENSNTDLFAIGMGESNSALYPLDSLIPRIKQVPKRLINSQCGSKYESQGYVESFTDFVEPNGVNFYRIHPNYFFNSDSTPRINIQESTGTQLTICSSRELLHVNKSLPIDSQSCKIITSATYTIDLSCGDASYIHQCQPYYFSVRANSSATPFYSCTDMNLCRFPDQIRFKISYENLVCRSGASSVTIMPLTIILAILYTFSHYY